MQANVQTGSAQHVKSFGVEWPAGSGWLAARMLDAPERGHHARALVAVS